MFALLTTTITLAFFSYCIATLIILKKLFKPQEPNFSVVLAFGCFAIITHLISLNILLFSGDYISFTLPNVIALVSVVITALITLLALKYKVSLLLPVSYSFAALWLVATLFIPEKQNFSFTANNFILITHISLALIAYCILIIASLYAFQVSYINQKLKNKNLMAVSNLPPLMQVENQLFIILSLGTASLLASQLLGIIFLENIWAKEQLHKTVLSLIALVFYMITLWGHFSQGWRGSKVLSLITFATTLLTLAYFGSRFVKEFLLI